MVTKGIIKSIDYSGNTCQVRIPLFESTNNDEVVLTAIFSITPGMYNGYLENDVVLVSFEDNALEHPIIIGKLYLGVAEEQNSPRGAINCGTINSKAPIEIPIDTKLSFDCGDETRVDVDKDLGSYKTIADLAKNLQAQQTVIGSINTKLIDDGESLGFRVTKLESDGVRYNAELIVNAEAITAEVARATDVESGLLYEHSKLTVQSNKIGAIVESQMFPSQSLQKDEGSISHAFGWDLTADEWTLFKKEGSAAGDPNLVWYSTVTDFEAGVGTYFFTNTQKWNKVYAYMWTEDEHGTVIKKNANYPGQELTEFEYNSYRQKVFEFAIDTREYEKIQFNNGTNPTPIDEKTVDIIIQELPYGYNAWYATEEIETGKGLKVVAWVKPTTDIDPRSMVDYITINGSRTTRPVADLPDGGWETLKALRLTKSGGYWYWSSDAREKAEYRGKPTNVEAFNIKRVLIANESGLTVCGKIEAESGHIGAFNIGAVANNKSGIYSDNYKDTTGAQITKFLPYSGTPKPNSSGVYVGTDGIMLGKKLFIDPNGNITASSLTLVGDASTAQKNTIDNEIESKVTPGWIESLGISVNKLLVKDDNDNKILDAGYSDSTQVIVGNLKVTKDGLEYPNPNNSERPYLSIGGTWNSWWGENAFIDKLRVGGLQWGVDKDDLFISMNGGGKNGNNGIDFGFYAGGAIGRSGFVGWGTIASSVVQIHSFFYDASTGKHSYYIYGSADSFYQGDVTIESGKVYRITKTGYYNGSKCTGAHCFDWVSWATFMTEPVASYLDIGISCTSTGNKTVSFCPYGTVAKDFNIVIFGCTQETGQHARW